MSKTDFTEKNRRRQAARGTRFGSLPARRVRRMLGGAFGTEKQLRQETARGDEWTINPHAYTWDRTMAGQRR